MTLDFRNENRKQLLLQVNVLLYRMLIIFFVYSSVVSIISYYLGAVGSFVLLDILFNLVRTIAILVVNRVVKDQDKKYIAFIILAIIGLGFSFFAIKDYLGVFYGSLIYCYITIIIISLNKKVAISFASLGIAVYLALFYFFPYQYVNLDISYYFSQIGFLLIYNYIVLKVMDYFKNYENKVYDQLELIEKQKTYLANSDERYRLVFDASQDGLWDFDNVSKEVYYSERALRLLNITDDQEDDFTKLHVKTINPEDSYLLIRLRRELLEGKRNKYSIEYKCQINDSISWLEENAMGLRDNRGNIKRIAGAISDITDKKHKDTRIHTLAYYDILTMLPNRSFFYEEISQHIETRLEEQEGFAIAIIDLDDFKFINDILGHESGDKVLNVIALRLTKCKEPNISFARLGGDEFGLIVYGNYDEKSIHPILTKISEMIEEEIIINKHSLKPKSSIGVAFFPRDGEDKEILMKNAELALYSVKSKGKGGYCFFDEIMAYEVSRKVEMEEDLKKSIINKELVLFYQPIVDAQTKQIKGYEALIRWNSNKYGMLSPSAFINMAETIGFINEMSLWVFTEAGMFIKNLNRGAESYTVSINISGLQIMDSYFFEEVKALTVTNNFDPTLMSIEITETSLITVYNHAINNIYLLREMGFKISIDDFGTGYSSLSYLKSLPVDIMKIDKSFIDNIDSNQKDLEILENIIRLAKILNMSIIAEGVERETQYLLLKERGCDHIQGYLFGKPAPQEDLMLI